MREIPKTKLFFSNTKKKALIGMKKIKNIRDNHNRGNENIYDGGSGGKQIFETPKTIEGLERGKPPQLMTTDLAG